MRVSKGQAEYLRRAGWCNMRLKSEREVCIDCHVVPENDKFQCKAPRVVSATERGRSLEIGRLWPERLRPGNTWAANASRMMAGLWVDTENMRRRACLP